MPVAAVPANEGDRLASLRSYEILDTAPEAAFDRLVTVAARVARCPIAAVSLLDADRAWCKAGIGLDVSETPRALAFCSHAILQAPEPLIVTDARRDPRFADNPLVTGAPGIRFYAGVPLVNEDGHALGTLCVVDTRPRDLDKEQRARLVQLAGTVTSTLDLRRAVYRLRRLAMTGALTSIADWPCFVAALDRALVQLSRYGFPFSLLYLDSPGFIRLAEPARETAADRALHKFAAGLAEASRREAWRPAAATTSARGGW